MLSYINLLIASFKMNFRNKQAIVWTFFMPVILMVMLGLAFGKEKTITMKVAVVDEAKNSFSREFVKGLKKVEAFKVSTGDKDGEMKALKDGDRSIVILLPKDFGKGPQMLIDAKKKAAEEAAKAAAANKAQVGGVPQAGRTPQDGSPVGKLPGGAQGPGVPAAGQPAMPKVDASELQVYYDQTNPNLAGTAKMIMSQVVSGMNQKIAGSPLLFKIAEKKVSTRKLSNIDFYTAGIIAMVTMQGGIMQVIMILVSYRERGILRRLKATPMSTSQFIGSQIAVRVVIALAQLGLLLWLAMTAFGANIIGSLWLLGLLVVEGALVFIALGFALASFAKTNQTAMALGQVVTMPMMFLSGVFFPTDSFPAVIQPVIKALPLNYLADGLRQVMMRGAGFGGIERDMAILALFGFGFFIVSVKLFKWE